jgi:hypothetical protein
MDSPINTKNEMIIITLPNIGGVVLDGIVEEERSQNVIVSNNPIGEGVGVTDIAYPEPDTIEVKGVVSTVGGVFPTPAKIIAIEEALFFLLNNNYFNNGISLTDTKNIPKLVVENLLISITTHKSFYYRYFITNLKTNIQYPEYILNVSLTAKKVRIVKLSKDHLRKNKEHKGVSKSGNKGNKVKAGQPSGNIKHDMAANGAAKGIEQQHPEAMRQISSVRNLNE